MQKTFKQHKAKSWDFNEMKLFQFNRFYTDKFFFQPKRDLKKNLKVWEKLEEKLESRRSLRAFDNRIWVKWKTLTFNTGDLKTLSLKSCRPSNRPKDNPSSGLDGKSGSGTSTLKLQGFCIKIMICVRQNFRDTWNWLF